MMEWIRFICGTAFIIFGLFFVVSAVIGNFHFKFALNRMHSAALGDTLGLLGVLVGLCFFNGFNSTMFKLIAIVAIIWITSPIASHLIMLMEISNGRYTVEVKDEFTDDEGFEKIAISAEKKAMEQSGDEAADSDDSSKEENK